MQTLLMKALQLVGEVQSADLQGLVDLLPSGLGGIQGIDQLNVV